MKTACKLYLFVAAIFILVGCVRYTVPEVVPVELLKIYKQENAEIPVKVKITNFVVNPVDADYCDDDKATFRRYNESNIPDKLYNLLGNGGAFSEVKRTRSALSGSADYVISGTYDFSEKRVKRHFYQHSDRYGKGVLRVQVMRARDGHLVLDKDFIEERTYEGMTFQAIMALYLQETFMKNIAAEIKKNIAQDVKKLSTVVPATSIK